MVAAGLRARHAQLILAGILRRIICGYAVPPVITADRIVLISLLGLAITMWIPGYRIVRTLGEGGMATVYLAIQENFQREVALKIMSPMLARGDASYGERFLREARIVAQLNHPHIVAVYDVGLHDGQHYLAMEYVPGDDLKARRLKLSLHQALGAVKQVAIALDYAHKKGYVHRDIKPENVLLSEDCSRAVLTDFGIARPSGVEGGLTQTGTAIGTPSYMSPEQALGKPLDHRTDLYSLGVVLYYMLIGEVPFTADSAVAVGIKHAVEPVPRLPPALIAFQLMIDKAMAKAADKRFQSGAEFAHGIDELLAALQPELEIAWRAQLKQTAATEAAAPSATIISGANPTAIPPTAAPRSPTPPAAEVALTANASERFGTAGKRAPARTPAPLMISSPAEKSKLPLVLAIVAVLGVAGGWYWYQQQQKNAAGNKADLNNPTESVAQTQPITPNNANEPATTGNASSTASAPETVAVDDSTSEPGKELSAPPLSETIPVESSANGAEPATNTGTEPSTATTTTTAGSTTDTTGSTTATTAEPVAAVDPKVEQINKLLADADKRLKTGKLIEPANDNAEALYNQVLKLDSQNAAAKEGRKNVGIALARQGIELSKAGDGLRATMLYERSVVLAPKARDVQLLKQRLESGRRAEQAKPLLDKAKQLETAGALITPANNNAYDLYKQAQAIDPASTQALGGLSQVEVKLADEIERLWRKGQVGEASALYAGAKERYPDSKDIADAGKLVLQGANRKPKPAETLDDELQRPEILSLRVSGNPLNSLPSEQTTLLVIGTSLHAAFTYQNFKPGATVIEAQLYDDTHQIKLGNKRLTLNYDAGEVRFQLDRPVEGFPDGDYFLDLFANGERLTSLTFKIQRADLF
jgi:serine/threonine protein kinase